MSSSRKPALNAEGFLFQLPSLGLPDPAGEWVQLRVAVGSQKSCALLLRKAKPGDTLRLIKPDAAKHDVVEAEMDGAVWHFPIFSASSQSSKPKSQPELLEVYVKRQAASSYASNSLARDLTRLPTGLQTVFLNKATKLFHYEGVDSSQKPSKKGVNNGSRDLPGHSDYQLDSSAAAEVKTAELLHPTSSADAQQVQPRSLFSHRVLRSCWSEVKTIALHPRQLPRQLREATFGDQDAQVHNSARGGTSGRQMSWPPRPTSARKKVRGKGKKELGGWWRDGGTPKALMTRLLLAVSLIYFLVVVAHPVGSARKW